MSSVIVTLDKLHPGQSGVIVQVGGEGALHDRLLEMGIIPGTSIAVTKLAPLGDPMELFIRGYALTVRKSEAALIWVQEGAAR